MLRQAGQPACLRGALQAGRQVLTLDAVPVQQHGVRQRHEHRLLRQPDPQLSLASAKQLAFNMLIASCCSCQASDTSVRAAVTQGLLRMPNAVSHIGRSVGACTRVYLRLPRKRLSM